MTRRNQNLSREEAARLRDIAEYHGITAPTGPYAGKGSGLGLQLAIITGDLAIVSIDPDDRLALAVWLDTQVETAPSYLADLVRDLAAELRYGIEPPEPTATPGEPSDDPINTMDG